MKGRMNFRLFFEIFYVKNTKKVAFCLIMK